LSAAFQMDRLPGPETVVSGEKRSPSNWDTLNRFKSTTTKDVTVANLIEHYNAA
jgi:hypothetical protein